MAARLLRFALIFPWVVTALDYSAPPNRVLGYLPDWPVTFWPKKGKTMTPQIPKPEWFQLTEADPIQPRPRINRVTRMLALSTPLLVLGVGYMVAQGSNGQGVPLRSLEVASAPAQIPSQNANSSTPTQASPSASQARVVPSSFTAPSSPIAPITKPTGGSDDAGISPTGGSDDGEIVD